MMRTQVLELDLFLRAPLMRVSENDLHASCKRTRSWGGFGFLGGGGSVAEKLCGGWGPALCLPTLPLLRTPALTYPWPYRCRDWGLIWLAVLMTMTTAGGTRPENWRTGDPARRWRLSTIAVANVTHIVTNCMNLFRASEGCLLLGGVGRFRSCVNTCCSSCKIN